MEFLRPLAIDGHYPVALFLGLFCEIAMLVTVLTKARPTLTTRFFNFAIFNALLIFVAQILQLYVKSDSLFLFLQNYVNFANVVVATPVILVFILLLVSKRKVAFSRPFLVPLSVWLLFTTPLILGTDLAYLHGREHSTLTNWIYEPQLGPLGWVPQINILFLLVIFGLLINGYRRVRSNNQKRQLLVVTFGFGLIFVLVTTLKGHTHPLVSVPTDILIIYAIIRYGFLATDRSTIGAEVLNIMRGAVWGITAEGEIIYTNTHGDELLGTKSKNIVGRHLKQLLPPEKYAEFDEAILKPMYAGKKISDFETVLVTDKNQQIHVAVNATPELDNKQKMIVGILVINDITALKESQFALEREKESVERKVIERTKELHNERLKLQASIEGLTTGFALVEPDGSIAIQNSALQNVLELEYEVRTLLQLDGVVQGLSLAKIAKEVQEKRTAVEVREVTSGSKILRIFASPVVNTEASHTLSLGTVIMFEDITEEKLLERSRDEFFSIASHELRTPLTAIKGNASMVLQFYSRVLKDKELREMIDDIHNSSLRLIDIVNDFLDLSRLEQGKMTFHNEAFELESVIESVMYEMKVVLQEKNLYLKFNRMTLGSLPKVWGDKSRIKQVAYNLLGNAAKFTESGGITVDAQVTKNAVKVLITDTGRGIAEEEQNLLFRKFQQAGQSLLTRDTTRGTGLGLYISKIMLEEMGGSIALESSVAGKGSTFSFSLPVATPALEKKAAKQAREQIDISSGLTKTVLKPAGQKADVASKHQHTDGHLLIIEDDPYVARLYQRLFRFSNVGLDIAYTGQEGLDKAHDLKPKLILLDIMMPNMNGLEVLEKLKADTKTKHIPVVMLTSIGEESIIASAKQLGADDYILKSDFTPEELLLKVQHYLK